MAGLGSKQHVDASLGHQTLLRYSKTPLRAKHGGGNVFVRSHLAQARTTKSFPISCQLADWTCTAESVIAY